MRIVLATDWFLPRLGGIELHLADLASHLVAAGHDVTVVTSTPDAVAPPGVSLAPLNVWRLPVVDVAASPRLPGALERVLAGGRFDVVHAHASVVSPVAFGAAAVARRLGIPLVVTFHSMLHAGTAALSLAEHLARWSRWPMVLSAVSGRVASQVTRAADALDVRVLPNGIDADEWRAPAPDGAPSSRIAEAANATCVVVSTMRLHRKKRPAALLAAFARARTLAPGAPMRLVIIGDGPERAALERQAASLGIDTAVTFAGRLPREVIARLYADAGVFASATLHESFGIAALEARAAGLPVVAMAQSGATEFLRHDVNALLAADDDELARQIAALASEPELRARLGAHRGDVERFAWSEVTGRHLAAYRDAIALRAASRA